ncbi:MAG: hypothetical protein HYY01_00170 [Chloroflexi bacterium]|nr:hypothetical protein [Chloroflexota bacterium]
MLLAGLALVLALAACLPAATPSLAPDPAPPQSSSSTEGAEPGSPPVVSADGEQSKPRPVSGPEKGSADGSGQAEAGQAVVGSPNQGGGVVEARPVVDQTYQWVGVVVESNLEGRHLEVKRDCDEWVLLPQSEDIARKLDDNVGNKVVIWGRVFTGVSIYMRQAISVQNAFDPKDPMVMLYVPEYPCPGTPIPPMPKPVPPVGLIVLDSGEIAARGTLVWEQGKPYLDTPAGRINLTLPPDHAAAPSSTETTPSAGAATRPASLDGVAVGKWRWDTSGLELAAHTVRPWPVNLMAKDPCGNLTSIEPLQPGEISARGDLVWDGTAPRLKTTSGPIQLSFANPEPLRPVTGDAVVLGKWQLGAAGLATTVREFLPLLHPCPPPPVTPTPPASSLLPGEIAAVGNLAWEGSQPYLDTPSGRILVSIPPDMAIPSLTATARPGSSSPVAQLPVVVVGKWSIKNGQLAIAVRYWRPWPGPTPVDPVPPQPPLPSTTPAPPPPGQGNIYGQVRIGPLCPVEPCPNPTPDVYSSRALVLQGEASEPIYVKLNPDGSFKALVKGGAYTVSLTDCTFLGCRGTLPKKVSVVANEAVLLEIDIDTGIR